MKKKRFFKIGIIGYIQKIIVMVIVTLLISFLISYYKNIDFGILLGYVGMGITAIGGVGGMGGARGAGETIHLQLLSTGKMGRNTMNHLQESYGFSIFMIISGIIVMLLSIIV